MAAEHYDLYDEEHEHEQGAGNAKKRSRITIDVKPSLRRRIRLAALKSDLSISEYVGEILDEAVPNEDTIPQHHPVTHKTLEQLREVQEQILSDREGKPFEDSTEMIRQMREERTRELMGEL
jgi:hypothetical protein